MLQKLRRDAEAESALKRALSVEPENPDYLYALAVFYLEQGNSENARKMAEKVQGHWGAGTRDRLNKGGAQ